MGMFTSIIHPDDGRELQIKSGNDDCEIYHVGDFVNWSIDKSWPKSGKLLDDVYSSYDDDWVVIKNHVVFAVIPKDYGDYNSIKEEYQIEELPDSEWPEESWIRARSLEENSKKEFDLYKKSIAHLSEKEQLAAIFAYPLRRRMNFQSYARKLFSIEPLNIQDIINDKTK